jgi:hypothetical protein
VSGIVVAVDLGLDGLAMLGRALDVDGDTPDPVAGPSDLPFIITSSHTNRTTMPPTATPANAAKAADPCSRLAGPISAQCRAVT